MCLRFEKSESEEDQEGHHKCEQSDRFGHGESHNAVTEQGLFQRWVTRHTDDESTEHGSDTNTGTSQSNGSGSSTDQFSGLEDHGLELECKSSGVCHVLEESERGHSVISRRPSEGEGENRIVCRRKGFDRGECWRGVGRVGWR